VPLGVPEKWAKMGQQMVKYMVFNLFNIETWGFPIKVGDLKYLN